MSNFETDNWPFVEAKFKVKVDGKRRVRLIVMHSMEFPEKGSTAFGSEAKAFQEELQEKTTGKKPYRGRNFESIIAKYVWRGQLKAGAGNEWRTFARREQPFRPTISGGRPNGVKYVRVLLYPFWPPGEYYVDNVKLVELDDNDPRVKKK